MDKQDNVRVTLDEGMAGKEQVICDLGSGQITLSLQQARILATKLIIVANRAEVRINLRHNHERSRKLST